MAGRLFDDGLPAESAAEMITAYCDGGSRGNPGPAGYGVSIEGANGQKIGELSEFLGVKTNNFAEYSALLGALEFALTQGHPALRVVADSELMVKQIKGQYQVKSPELRPLYDEAKRRIAKLERFEIQHVLRNKNQRADALANEAMDGSPRRFPRPLRRLRSPEEQRRKRRLHPRFQVACSRGS
jgi:probable phosphoglycerate mutase